MNVNSNTSMGAGQKKRPPDEGLAHQTLDFERITTVLQILPALNTGGVERSTVEVSEAIVNAGGRALVVSGGGNMVHEIKRVHGEHIQMQVHSKNPFVIYSNIERLAKVIEEHKVDVVHVRSRAPAWSAYFAAKKCGKPLVITFHGTYSFGNFFKSFRDSLTCLK